MILVWSFSIFSIFSTKFIAYSSVIVALILCSFFTYAGIKSIIEDYKKPNFPTIFDVLAETLKDKETIEITVKKEKTAKPDSGTSAPSETQTSGGTPHD